MKKKTVTASRIIKAMEATLEQVKENDIDGALFNVNFLIGFVKKSNIINDLYKQEETYGKTV